MVLSSLLLVVFSPRRDEKTTNKDENPRYA